MSGRTLWVPRRAVAGWAAALLLPLRLLLLPGSQAAAQPVPSEEQPSALRLTLELPSRILLPGVELAGRVVLRGRDGAEAATPRPLGIRVETQFEGDGPRVVEVEIAAGQASAPFRVRADRLGMVRVRASHPELMETGTFLRCVPANLRTTPVARPDARTPGRSRLDELRIRPDAGPLGGIGATGAAGSGARPQARPSPLPTIPRPAQPPPPPPPVPTRTETVRDVVPPAPRTEESERARVTLRLSPQRAVLADGRDALSVLAFLDRAAPADLRLNLLPTIGRIDPRPLVIRRGEMEATAVVTGQDAGEVEIELVNTDPAADLDGERRLKARFAAPVAALRVSADPANVTFVETAKVTVRLQDTEGRPVATDEPRSVDLTLDRGHGTLQRDHITIEKGRSEASTTFEPTWPGAAAFSASSPSLFRQSSALRVTWPVGLLVISLLGGVVGGALALLRNRRQHVQRVATGGVTGFVLYWAFIAGLLPVLPRNIVLNPLSVFALSTLGGWMGTEVFAFVLRKLGIIDGDGKEAKGEEAGAAEEAGRDKDEGESAGRKPKRRRAGGG